ncbi:hypothetical protein [Dictyobacter formicarum]|uniref:hypothetical protein n=1 Tax=Dictyobacter formicarum TaxID=2778368 RepID=UPI0019152349|nr:hypothetical protein [Dictyobacter formicarum]
MLLIKTKADLSSCLSKVCWILPLIVLLVGPITTSASAATRSTSIATASSESGDIPGFSRFVGSWYAHGAGLAVHADGQAHFKARVYTWCGPGVKPPCDSFQGDTIVNGYTEDLLFSRVSGNVAYGTITAGNVGPVGSSVTMTLIPGNQLLFSAGKGMGNHLCGPQAPVGACGA